MLYGLIRNLDETLSEYQDPGQDPLWQPAVRVLRTLPVAEVAAGARVDKATVIRARAGKLTATNKRAQQARDKLTSHTLAHARAQLRADDTRPPTDPEALLARCREHFERRCARCGKPLTGKQRKYCSTAHERTAVEPAAATQAGRRMTQRLDGASRPRRPRSHPRVREGYMSLPNRHSNGDAAGQ